MPPMAVRDMVENPEVKRLAAEARQMLDRENQSVVLPALSWVIVAYCTSENLKYISHTIKILLRNQFKHKCRNVDLYILPLFKYCGKRRLDWQHFQLRPPNQDISDSASPTALIQPDMLIMETGGLALLQFKTSPNELPIKSFEKYSHYCDTPFVYAVGKPTEPAGKPTAKLGGDNDEDKFWPLRRDDGKRSPRSSGNKDGRSKK